MTDLRTDSHQDHFLSSTQDLGLAIRAARKQASLRVIDAALLAGVAVQTLVDLEAGRPGVGIGKVMQVADVLGVSLFAVPAKERERLRNMLLHATLSSDGKQV